MRKKHLFITSIILFSLATIVNLSAFSSLDFKINKLDKLVPDEVIILSDYTLDINIENSLECFGDTDGEIRVVPMDCGQLVDLSTLDFSWTDSSGAPVTINGIGDVANDLGAGTYTIVVSRIDIGNDTIFYAQDSINLTQPEEFFIDFEKCLDADQKIRAIVEGGTPGYSFYWEDSNGSSPGTESYLTAVTIGESYFITVTDGNGCEIMESVTLTEADQISIEPMIQHISCMGGNDGSISVTATGGSGNYEYQWSTGMQDATFSIDSLFPGSYTVTVTDDKACSKEETFTIEDSDIILQITNAQEVEMVTFEDNTSKDIIYQTNIDPQGMEWEILESENVDTTGLSLGMGVGSTLTFTFELIEKSEQGMVKISVIPISDLCQVDSSGETTIHILPSETGETAVVIPEIISPNNDNENDEWNLEFPLNNREDYSVMVFSRNGYKVYSADPVSLTHWEGTGCPDGTYYYILKNKTTDETLRGAVSIIRGNTN